MNCYDGHDGIDFDLNYEQVLAAADGTVTRAGWDDPNRRAYGYGLFVEIRHSNNYVTRYGHLSAIAVSENQQVYAGQIIGTSGNTGNSGGRHLHFGAIAPNGQPVDPFGWSGGGADPWAGIAQSWFMWKDGQWANLGRPIPAPASGGMTIIDDTTNNSGGFSKGSGGPYNNVCTNDCGGWTTEAAGYGGHLYYTPADGNADSDQWAKWNAPASASG